MPPPSESRQGARFRHSFPQTFFLEFCRKNGCIPPKQTDLLACYQASGSGPGYGLSECQYGVLHSTTTNQKKEPKNMAAMSKRLESKQSNISPLVQYCTEQGVYVLFPIALLDQKSEAVSGTVELLNPWSRCAWFPLPRDQGSFTQIPSSRRETFR